MFSLPVPLLIVLSVIASALIGILRGKYAKSYPMSGVYLWRFNFYQNIFCFLSILLIYLFSGTEFSFSVFSVLLGAALLLGNLCACTSTAGTDADTDTNTENSVAQQLYDTPVAAPDLTNAATITLSGTDDVTVSDGGVYVLTGTLTDGRVLVNAPDADVTLVLQDADITCSDSSALYIYKAASVLVYLPDGTASTLTDGSSYDYGDGVSSAAGEEPNACLYSKSDLIIAGGGTLTVTGNAGNGITGKDTLKIEDTAVSVTAANHGINGKDCLVLKQADVTVTSGGDALPATNDSDTALGCVLIGASALTLTAGEDGIQAETTLTLFDTTGTVTSGEPTVTDICPVPGVTEAELLGAACALEQKSEHPLAKAVLRRAQADGLTAAEVTAFQALPGSGLQAVLDGQKLCGGNADFIRTAAALPDVVSVRAEQLAEEGKTPLFFARGGKLLGVIAVADVLKPDSPQAIRALQNMGIRVVMLTGDNARTAKAIGAQAGVDEVIAGVLPDGKEREIRRLSARGKVAMVGDGINDAPALTRADVGIAIGAGTDVAIDAADVVLVNSRLSDVPAAIRLSRATLRNIHENLFWAFFYNTIGIPVAAGVFVPLGLTLSPMLGAAAMSLSSFCVVTNALRLNLFDLHDARRDHKRASHLKEVPEIKEETTMKKTISIEGMMCTHCEATVKKALEALPEVTEAAVSHTAGTAVVTLSAPVDDAALKAAVEAKDYTVTGIA